jgi:hypothetical protein
MIWQAHFEGASDAERDAVINGTPSGCTDNASWVITRTNTTYSNTAGNYIDGAYGLLASGFDRMSVVPIGATSGLLSAGSVSGWAVRKNVSYTARLFYMYFDATHIIYTHLGTDNTATLYVYNGAQSSSVVAPAVAGCSTVDGAGCYIQAAWDFTPANGSDKVFIRLCTGPGGSGTCQEAGYTNQTITDNLALAGTYTTGIGSSTIALQTFYSAVDNVSIWNSYQGWTE